MDLFDVLDVSLNEDTYSSLLVHVFRRFPNILAGVFGELTGKTITGKNSVKFRRQIGSDSKDKPDIVVEAETDSGIWWLVIEAKVQSGEGHEQTRRYAALCEIALQAKKHGGSTLCYLTLAGDDAEMDAGCKGTGCWHVLTHLELVQLIDKYDVRLELQSDVVLSVPWCAYKARLEHYEHLEAPTDDQRILDWLGKPSEYFITRDERALALAETLFPKNLLCEGGIYPGKGKDQFYAHAHEPGWNTGYFSNRTSQRLVDCLSVHYELSFPVNYKEGGVRFRLNLLTNPYMTESEIEAVGKAKFGFQKVRKFLRGQLHDRLRRTNWKAANHKLQMAKVTCELDEATTVGKMKAVLAPHIATSREKINAAMKATAREYSLRWTKGSALTNTI